MAVIGSQLTYCVEVAAELLADVEEQTVRSVHQAQRPGRESPGSETVKNPDPDSFRPQNQRSRTQNPKQTRPQPLLKEAGLTKPTAAHPSGGPVAGGAIGTSGMPLTASGRERPPHSDACKQAPGSWVS